MKSWCFGSVSAAAMALVPVAGWSLNAQDVWQKWQDLAEIYGQTVTNDGVEMMDGTLTVRNLVVAIEDGVTDATVRFSDVAFAEQPDGTVEIRLPESFPLEVIGVRDLEEEEDAELGLAPAYEALLLLEAAGLKMTASEAGNGMDFAFVMPALSMTMDKYKVYGEDFPITVNMTVTGGAGSYSAGATADDPMVTAFEAAGTMVNLGFRDPDTGNAFSFDAALEEITSQSAAKYGENMNPDQVAEALRNGFDMVSGVKYGPTTFNLLVEAPDETTQAEGSMSGGNIDLALNAGEFKYDVGYEGLDLTVSSDQMPIGDMTFKLDSASTLFSMPILTSDEATPFALRTALEGLQIGEELWSLFDPAAVLPRDPATLIVDLAGTGFWSIDILDPVATLNAQIEGTVPGAVETVDLKELKLSVVGSELTGNGAFTLDNEDLETFDGMPRPEGAAQFRLTGGNALLDRLVQMGIVPQDQVMMVRMMTGMFAKPGAGPDELTSEISVDGEGMVLINGAPLPF